jgi:hypothetical protein
VNAVTLALSTAEGEVATMDVLGLEALRVFDPALHEALGDLIDIVSSQQYQMQILRGENVDVARARLQKGLDASSTPRASRTILTALFPQADRLLREESPMEMREWRDDGLGDGEERRRVAARSVFATYLYSSFDHDAISHADVDRAVQALGDRRAFAEVLRGTEQSRLPALLRHLRARLVEVSRIDVPGVATETLLHRDRFPPFRPSRWLEINPVRRVMWFIEDLVAAQELSDQVPMVEEMVVLAPNLSAKDLLLSSFFAPTRFEHLPAPELFDPERQARESRQLVEIIVSSKSTELAQERNLLALLSRVSSEPGYGRGAVGGLVVDAEMQDAFLRCWAGHPFFPEKVLDSLLEPGAVSELARRAVSREAQLEPDVLDALRLLQRIAGDSK